MVRLKGRVQCTRPQSITEFQFHYGTIKRKHHALPLLDYVTSFQFHYGTIKRQARRRVNTRVISFNSTMVRLKAYKRRSCCSFASVFQFHYGTIKSFDMQEEDRHRHCFNSTMVRLKVRKRTLKAGRAGFQFHYGTIKSPVRVSVRVPRCLFQFHYGTIKSYVDTGWAIGVYCFNSTMVRLKAFYEIFIIHILCSFNSTMVRLKAVPPLGGSVSAASGFQFHYGTIKSEYICICPPARARFQFHYGTIKRCSIIFDRLIESSFNSTMVRLKDKTRELEVKKDKPVSIPLWYD